MLRVLSLVLVLLLLVPFTAAQEASEAACTSEIWMDYQNQLVELSMTLSTSETPLEVLQTLDELLTDIQINCGEGRFTKADHPNGIIGPLTLDGALYEVTLETAGSLGVMTPTAVEGNCGALFGMPVMTGMSGGAQGDIWQVNGCVVLVKIDATMASDWAFTLKRLR